MKRLLAIVLFFALGSPAWAQSGGTGQPIYRTFNLTVAHPIGPENNSVQVKGTGVTQFIINWTAQGTISTCNVKLQKSADGASWSDLIAATSCTSNGTATLTIDYTNYVRVNATTITGAGTLVVNLLAFPPGQTLTATVDTTGLALASNQTDGTQKTLVCDVGGDCSTVTGSKLDVNATVSTVGLATSAIQTDGTQISQICDAGADCVTVTGSKLDVNASVDTTGLATSTKQSDGTQKTQIVDGSGNVIAATSNAMNVYLAGGGATGVAQNSTTSGQLGTLAMAATTTSAPSYTTAKTNPLSTDTSGNLRVAGPADVANTTPPAYANADPVTTFEYALNGQLIVFPYQNPAYFVNGTSTAITDTTSTAVISSAGGSLRNYITHCSISNTDADTDTLVKILDGSTVIAEQIAVHGGGAEMTFPTPLRGTAATAVNAQPVTTGASIIVSCNGFKGL